MINIFHKFLIKSVLWDTWEELRIRESFDCLELDDGDDRVECLWVRVGGRPTRQISWWESVIDHPIRMKRQMKYSMSSQRKSHDR